MRSDRSFAVRIRVDPEVCQGHNRCTMIAPDLFKLDDIGMATAADDGVIPSGREEAARLAIANCPEFAISIVDE